MQTPPQRELAGDLELPRARVIGLGGCAVLLAGAGAAHDSPGDEHPPVGEQGRGVTAPAHHHVLALGPLSGGRIVGLAGRRPWHPTAGHQHPPIGEQRGRRIAGAQGLEISDPLELPRGRVEALAQPAGVDSEANATVDPASHQEERASVQRHGDGEFPVPRAEREPRARGELLGGHVEALGGVQVRRVDRLRGIPAHEQRASVGEDHRHVRLPRHRRVGKRPDPIAVVHGHGQLRHGFLTGPPHLQDERRAPRQHPRLYGLSALNRAEALDLRTRSAEDGHQLCPFADRGGGADRRGSPGSTVGRPARVRTRCRKRRRRGERAGPGRRVGRTCAGR